MGAEPGYWVVIGSANGSGNLGDEAMWHAAVASLRDIVGDVPVVTDAAGHWGADGVPGVTELPYLYTSLVRAGSLQRSVLLPVRLAGKVLGRVGRWQTVRRRTAADRRRPRTALQRRWHDTIVNAEGVLFSGAGAITDRYAVNGVYAWSLLAQWAADADVPVAFLGQGLGPLSPDHHPAVRDALTSAQLVGVRDSRSLEFAVGLEVATARLQPDWATLAIPAAADHEAAKRVVPEGPEGFLAVCLHAVAGEANDDALATILGHVLTTAEESGLAVLLVPNMRGDGPNDDERTMRRLLDRVSPALRANAHILSERLSARQTRALLGRARAVIATRYHSLVFATSEATWTVGVAIDDYWEQKLRGAQRNAGQPELVLPSDASADAVRDLIGRALRGGEAEPLAPLRGDSAVADLEGFIRMHVRQEDDGASAER